MQEIRNNPFRNQSFSFITRPIVQEIRNTHSETVTFNHYQTIGSSNEKEQKRNHYKTTTTLCRTTTQQKMMQHRYTLKTSHYKTIRCRYHRNTAKTAHSKTILPRLNANSPISMLYKTLLLKSLKSLKKQSFQDHNISVKDV